MSDNDLRKQVQQATAQASAIKTGQQQNSQTNLRPPATNNYGLNGVVNLRKSISLRGSQSLSDGADLTGGINFADDKGEAL